MHLDEMKFSLGMQIKTANVDKAGTLNAMIKK